MPLFRKLSSDEIDVRIGNISEKGAMLLLYKNARCDMNILDETVGEYAWQRKHYECKGNLFCSVGILDKENGWIWKDDAGAESNTEKEKGEASDSFKRACTNWGIGRELYTSPFIWVSAFDEDEIENYKSSAKNGKHQTYEKFKVTKIEYKDDKISELIIVNSSNKEVFIFPKKRKGENKSKALDEKEIPESPKFNCEICKKSVSDGFAKKSYDKYGKVYCSGECKDKDAENTKKGA